MNVYDFLAHGAEYLRDGVRIVLILAGSFALLRFSRFIIRKLEKSAVEKHEKRSQFERSKQVATLGRILRNASAVAIVVVAIIMVLDSLGIDIGPLLAGAGVVGLALGFGAQSLVRDVISGFFILLENHFGVGDVIQAAGVSGLVESMTLRVTVLRDLEGRVHVIPNGEIKVMTNLTKEWSRAVIDVVVPAKEKIDQATAILRAVGEELARDPQLGPFILQPLEVLGLEQVANSQATLRVMIKTAPRQQWDVSREFRRRLLDAFEARGIEVAQILNLQQPSPYGGKAEPGVLRIEVDPPPPAPAGDLDGS